MSRLQAPKPDIFPEWMPWAKQLTMYLDKTSPAELTYQYPEAFTAVGRTVADRLAEVVSVQDFGADPDEAENTDAFQAAIDAAVDRRQALSVPAGIFNFAADAPPLDPGLGPLVIVGAGRDQTVLKFNEGTGVYHSDSTARNLFENTANSAKEALHFENLTFRGTLDTRGAIAGATGGVAQYLDYYSEISYINCAWSQLTSLANDHHYLRRLIVDRCRMTNIAADGCRARDTANVTISNSYFNRVGDDSIALHTATDTLAAQQPIREGLLIHHNLLVNAGMIKALGGRKMNVSHNHLNLCNINAIAIQAGDGTEGDNAVFQLTVIGNMLSNLVRVTSGTPTQGNACMVLGFPAARGASATNNTAPLQYDATSGTIIRPWNWYDHNAADTANAVPPGTNLVVANNTVMRTLPTASAFSEYGYGSILRSGVSYDPAMTDANLLPDTGIQFSTAPPHNSIIEGNVFANLSTGITLPAPANAHTYKGLSIHHNRFFAIVNRGILFDSPGGVTMVDVDISDNSFDMDYFRENGNSNIDGSYDADTVPNAIDLGNCIGLTIKNNRFRNCCNMIKGNALTSCLTEGNVGFAGSPAAEDFNTGNKGIGSIPISGGYRFVIVDADPTSGTFNALVSQMAMDAASIPTSGWYYRGWFVRKINPNNAGKVIGWARITTGTAHVSGTDWLVVTSV